MAYFSVVDYCVLFGTMIISLIIGLLFAWKDRKKSNDEFLVGGRRMSVFPVVISLLASYLTAHTFIGWPVEVYSRGSQLFMSIIAGFVATFFAAEVFIPIYYKINAVSVNKYLLERFESKKLLVVTSVLMTISRIPSLGIVLFSPALAFGVATGISSTTCVLITGFVVTIYASFGGLKAVIWTDFFQFILMSSGLLAIIVKGTQDVGGIGNVLQRNADGGRIELFNFNFNPYMSNNIWTVALGTSFVYTAAYSTDQLAVQRSISLPTIKKAKRALYLVMFGLFFVNVLVLYLGMVIFAFYHKCDPLMAKQISRVDEIATLFVGQIFENSAPGLLGLFVTSIFCCSLSTLSAGLNGIAALIWEDWLKDLIPNAKARTSLLITKTISIVIGVVTIGAAFLAMNIGTIFEASFVLVGAPVGPLFGLFVLGVVFPNVNHKSAICALVFGQLTSVWITVGSVLNKVSSDIQTVLPTSTEGCNSSLQINYTDTVPFNSLKNATIPNYTPQGWNLLYHLSPLFIPIVTFTVTVVIGNICCVIFGNEKREIDPLLICQFVNRFRKISNPKKEEIPLNVNVVDASAL